MFNNHVLHGFRNLTETEIECAERAIEWLIRKHTQARTIALLTLRQIDRESKTVTLKRESKHIIYYRSVNYEGTALEEWLKILPNLKIKLWVFPNAGHRGRTEVGGFHVHVEAVENFAQNRKQKALTLHRRFAIIEVSANHKMNIQKQITVGRRIALRA